MKRWRIFQGALFRGNRERSWSVTTGFESGKAAGLCLVGIHREDFVIATARMRDVIHAPAQRLAVPAVIEVERQRSLRGDGRLQRGSEAPSLEADAGDKFTAAPGGNERHETTIADDGVSRGIKTFDFHLQSIDR